MKKKAAHLITFLQVKTIVLNLFIFIVYVAFGKMGLAFASVNPSTTAIWPATGIALASLLLFGYRVIPAILLGAFIVNLTTAGTVVTSFGISIGNTLEGVVGAYLVNRFANGVHAFSSAGTIFKFVFFAALLSTTVSANIGIATLLLGHLASWRDFFSVWSTWWLGDAGGDLVFAPLILVWSTSSGINLYFKDAIKILLSFFILCLAAWLVFSGITPYTYLSFPIAVWIAFWFGRRGATIATIIISIIAIFYTLHGFGPFATGQSINRSLILLQVFLGILSITSLIFAALVHEIRKSKSTLAAHEARFKALIEKSFDAVVLIDASSKILYASPSVKRVLGYDPDELLGVIGFTLIAPEDRPFTIRTLAKLALKAGTTVTIHYRVIQKNKNIIWVEAMGTNLLFDKDINAVVVNFRDITEKKALEENILREKTADEAMLASIGDGIIATESTGRITVVNHSACEMLGWNKNELIGKFLTEIIPLTDNAGKQVPMNERPITKVLSLSRNIVTSRKHYYARKDKTTFPVRFRLTPIEIEGKIVGTIEVFQDITREKEIDLMKDEFISMASHELRTPMTAVNGLLSMILHGDYGPINEKLKHPLNNIQISAQRQIHLINDLLNVSRLQTGKIDFTFSNFSLHQVLDDVVKSLEPIATQKGLRLTLQDKEDSIVYADSEWSKHILNNLIGNGLKFTDKGGVTLSSSVKDDLVSIAVTDTGSGIERQDQNKLFGKFQQLNGQTSSKPPGSGLGLYLSRELAQKMSGDVKLDRSILGRGSTFIFTLPKAHLNKNKKPTETMQKKIAISTHTS